jgi:uncharacterized protein (AIM24 family)
MVSAHELEEVSRIIAQEMKDGTTREECKKMLAEAGYGASTIEQILEKAEKIVGKPAKPGHETGKPAATELKRIIEEAHKRTIKEREGKEKKPEEEKETLPSKPKAVDSEIKQRLSMLMEDMEEAPAEKPASAQPPKAEKPKQEKQPPKEVESKVEEKEEGGLPKEKAGEERVIKTISTDYKIDGQTTQYLTAYVDAEKRLFTRNGRLVWMSTNVNAKPAKVKLASKGIIKSIVESGLTGTVYDTHGERGIVCLSPLFPSTIAALELEENQPIIVRRDCLFGFYTGVKVEEFFKKRLGPAFRAKLLVLDKISGSSTLFLQATGDICERELRKEESIVINLNCIVAFEPSVTVEASKELQHKEAFEDAADVFVARLVGPGRIWMQSMPRMVFAYWMRDNMNRL